MPDPPSHPHDAAVEPADRRPRRQLLEYLLVNGGVADLGELSRAVAADGAGAGEPVTREAVDRARAALRRRHVPELEGSGVVEYDPEDGAVRLVRPDAALSELPPPEPDRTPRALGLFALAALLGAVVVVRPGSALVAPATAGAVVALFVAVALQYRRRRAAVAPLAGRSPPE